jgi:hypothetical protein
MIKSFTYFSYIAAYVIGFVGLMAIFIGEFVPSPIQVGAVAFLALQLAASANLKHYKEKS